MTDIEQIKKRAEEIKKFNYVADSKDLANAVIELCQRVEELEGAMPLELVDRSRQILKKSYEEKIQSQQATIDKLVKALELLLNNHDTSEKEIRDVKRKLINVHNNDDHEITVENLRAFSLVLAGQLGYQIEAVNPWNMKPAKDNARQCLAEVRGEKWQT